MFEKRLCQFAMIVPVLVAVAATAACTFVSLKPQAEKVRVLAPQEVRRCRHLGKVTANTTATVGFIARSRDSINEEVQNLARNHAAGMSGDTIVPASPLLDGEQSFEVYRCINP
jgi:Domain of unknown function (DUF4156)